MFELFFGKLTYKQWNIKDVELIKMYFRDKKYCPNFNYQINKLIGHISLQFPFFFLTERVKFVLERVMFLEKFGTISRLMFKNVMYNYNY